MKTVEIKMYDRLDKSGPKMRVLNEDVYGPNDDCPHGCVPWRDATEVGQWVVLDDGGKARVLRITDTKMGIWYMTPCGEGRPGVEDDAIVSTGSFHRGSRFTYSSFVDVDGRQIPKKVKDYCDHLLLTGDPVTAVRLAHPRRTRYIEEEARFPAVLERQRARDRNRAQDMMRREDVQWYMKHSLKDSMLSTGISPDYLFSKLRAILDDEGTSPEIARKTALSLIQLWNDNMKEAEDGVVGIDADKLKVIRSKRTSLRKKQKVVGE